MPDFSVSPAKSQRFVIRFFGYKFFVRPSRNIFSYGDVEMPLSYTGGELSLRIISDVLGCEIFADGGLIYTVAPSTADYGIRYLTLTALDKSGTPDVELTVHTLKGIW